MPANICPVMLSLNLVQFNLIRQGKFNVRGNSKFFEECKVLFPVKEQIFQADIPCQNGATNYY